MIIKEVNIDIREALVARDEIKLSSLRMLLAALKNKMIELQTEELKDKEAFSVVKSEIKKRKDAITIYSQGEREDLVAKEQGEINVLEKYLPPALSDEEILKAVEEVISEIGEVSPQDFGKVMKAAMAKLQGQADGKSVSEIVKNKLE